jgi:hypothetical protein
LFGVGNGGKYEKDYAETKECDNKPTNPSAYGVQGITTWK